jgi:hypothetical protein
MSDEGVVLTDEDIIAAADQIVDEIASVFEKVRGKVPAISVCLALLFAAKKVVEGHINKLKPEEKQFLTTVLCNFFDQTYLLLNPIFQSEKGDDGGRSG